MKIEDKTLDFKFLNIMMYCAFAFLICFFLKSIGILEKLLQALLALAPIYLGFIICWISTPLANLLKKIGLNKSVSAFLSLIIIVGVIVLLLFIVVPMFITQITELVKDFPEI